MKITFDAGYLNKAALESIVEALETDTTPENQEAAQKLTEYIEKTY